MWGHNTLSKRINQKKCHPERSRRTIFYDLSSRRGLRLRSD